MKILAIALTGFVALTALPALGALMMSPMILAAANPDKSIIPTLVFLLILALPITIIGSCIVSFAYIRYEKYKTALSYLLIPLANILLFFLVLIIGAVLNGGGS